MELQDLLSIIPELINLFLPGFACMNILYWIKNKNVEGNMSTIMLWSLFVTASIRAVCSLVHLVVLPTFNFPEAFKLICYLLIGMILPFVWNKISTSKALEWFLHKTTDKSIHDDIFDNLFDYTKYPLMIHIYLKNAGGYYVGQYITKKEKGSDSWIAITDYRLVNRKEKIVTDSVGCGERSVAMVQLSDIDRIELVYGEKSPTWKRIHPW